MRIRCHISEWIHHNSGVFSFICGDLSCCCQLSTPFSRWIDLNTHLSLARFERFRMRCFRHFKAAVCRDQCLVMKPPLDLGLLKLILAFPVGQTMICWDVYSYLTSHRINSKAALHIMSRPAANEPAVDFPTTFNPPPDTDRAKELLARYALPPGLELDKSLLSTTTLGMLLQVLHSFWSPQRKPSAHRPIFIPSCVDSCQVIRSSLALFGKHRELQNTMVSTSGNLPSRSLKEAQLVLYGAMQTGFSMLQ